MGNCQVVKYSRNKKLVHRRMLQNHSILLSVLASRCAYPRHLLHHPPLLWRPPNPPLPLHVPNYPDRLGLTGTTLVGFAEHEELNLIVDGEHTSTGDTTENI